MDKKSLFPIVLKSISKKYTHKGQHVEVLQNFSLTIEHGETIALVGASGSGKSTLGRIIASMELPTEGSVQIGSYSHDLTREEKKYIRKKIQMIFQDHSAVLNPMMTIEEIIGEGIDIHQLASGLEREQIIKRLLIDVGLPTEFMHRYPCELSGGQKQRVGIARALAVDPDIIVCDEPLSALDLCTQEQILDLLKDLKKKRMLTYLFITHDIDAVKGFADRTIHLLNQ